MQPQAIQPQLRTRRSSGAPVQYMLQQGCERRSNTPRSSTAQPRAARRQGRRPAGYRPRPCHVAAQCHATDPHPVSPRRRDASQPCRLLPRSGQAAVRSASYHPRPCRRDAAEPRDLLARSPAAYHPYQPRRLSPHPTQVCIYGGHSGWRPVAQYKVEGARDEGEHLSE